MHRIISQILFILGSKMLQKQVGDSDVKTNLRNIASKSLQKTILSSNEMTNI